MRIYKYPLGDDRYASIKMPGNSKILKVDSQFDEGFLWVMVNDYSEEDTRNFKSYMTGEMIDPRDSENYVGTYMTHSGNYVVHVFEVK